MCQHFRGFHLLADVTQGICHVLFHRFPGDLESFGNLLMLESFHTAKLEYLFLLGGKIGNCFSQRLLQLVEGEIVQHRIFMLLSGLAGQLGYKGLFHRHLAKRIVYMIAGDRSEPGLEILYIIELVAIRPDFKKDLL